MKQREDLGIRVWELDPPAGEERLEWILLTNEPGKLSQCFES